MSLIIREGSLLDYFDDIVKKATEHNAIYQPHPDLPEFCLDTEAVLRGETQGLVFSVLAEDAEGIKGFICSGIVQTFNYKELFSQTLVIYVDPSLGNKRIKVLRDMIAFHEEQAKFKGVVICQLSLSAVKDISSLTDKLGYTRSEIIVHKRVN